MFKVIRYRLSVKVSAPLSLSKDNGRWWKLKGHFSEIGKTDASCDMCQFLQWHWHSLRRCFSMKEGQCRIFISNILSIILLTVSFFEVDACIFIITEGNFFKYFILQYWHNLLPQNLTNKQKESDNFHCSIIIETMIQIIIRNRFLSCLEIINLPCKVFHRHVSGPVIY